MAINNRSRRLTALAVAAVVLLGSLSVRMWFMQAVQAKDNELVVLAVRTRTIRLLPERGRIFDAKGRVRETADNLPRADETKRLQGAINPLFNDIADRSRLGRIEDQLFAAGSENDLNFVLPERINWSTEGQTFEVPTDRTQRAFPIHVTRFWYLHGNGSMSWHVSFDVNYRNDKFEAALEQKRVPHALYLLSLMQKLAYPKDACCGLQSNPRRGTVLWAKTTQSNAG